MKLVQTLLLIRIAAQAGMSKMMEMMIMEVMSKGLSFIALT